MNEHFYHQREQDFAVIMPEIRRIPALHKIAEQYAMGHIMTKEEALFQMVRVLSTDWNAKMEDAIRVYSSLTPALFIKADQMGKP